MAARSKVIMLPAPLGKVILCIAVLYASSAWGRHAPRTRRVNHERALPRHTQKRPRDNAKTIALAEFRRFFRRGPKSISKDELDTLKNIKLSQSYLYKRIREKSHDSDAKRLRTFLSSVALLKQTYLRLRNLKNPRTKTLRKASDDMVAALATLLEELGVNFKLEKDETGRNNYIEFSRRGNTILNKLVDKVYDYTRSNVRFDPFASMSIGIEGFYLERAIYVSPEAAIRVDDDNQVTHLLKHYDVAFHEYLHALHDFTLTGLKKEDLYSLEFNPQEGSEVVRQGSYAEWVGFTELPAHLLNFLSSIKAFKEVRRDLQHDEVDDTTKRAEAAAFSVNEYTLDVVEALSSDTRAIATDTLERLERVSLDALDARVAPDQSVSYETDGLIIKVSTTNYFKADVLGIRVQTALGDFSFYSPDAEAMKLFTRRVTSAELKTVVQGKIQRTMSEALAASEFSLNFSKQMRREFATYKSDVKNHGPIKVMNTLDRIVELSASLRRDFRFN